MFEDMMWMWIMVFLVTAVFEFITPGNLITIWFSIGALAALAMERLNLDVFIQVLVFLIISFGSLLLVRPFTHRLLRGETVMTNADRIIGTQFRLENNLYPKEWYQQKVNSEVWSISPAQNQSITQGALVEVISIDGVKLVVREIKERNDV